MADASSGPSAGPAEHRQPEKKDMAATTPAGRLAGDKGLSYETMNAQVPFLSAHMKITKIGGYPSVFGPMDRSEIICKFVITPSVVCTLALLTFFNSYGNAPRAVTTAVFIGLVFLSLNTVMSVGLRSPNALLWGLCLFALAIGATAGFLVNEYFLAKYWGAQRGRSYPEVQPGEPAGAYADASMLNFEGAVLDPAKSAGHYDGDMLYCVAPVLPEGQQDDATHRVEFWAVGKDCCFEVGGFDCDDAGMRNAQAGLVVRDTGGWFNEWNPAYQEAVAKAGDHLGLTSSDRAIYLRWVEDPEVVATNYVYAAAGACIAVNFGFLAILGLAVSLLMA